MAALVVIPMRITRVPPTRASASQSGSSVPCGSPTRPVTTVTEAARPRWVTGMPTAAGTPKADVTPGTTSQGIAGLRQRLHLLTAAAEEEGVAPLEADHDGGRPAVLHQQTGRSPPGARPRASLPGSARRSGSLPTSISSAEGGPGRGRPG